jgi:hypothetical protein
MIPLKKRVDKTGQCAGRIRMYQSQRCITHFPGDAITNILPVLIVSVYRESLTVGVRKT